MSVDELIKQTNDLNSRHMYDSTEFVLEKAIIEKPRSADALKIQLAKTYMLWNREKTGKGIKLIKGIDKASPSCQDAQKLLAALNRRMKEPYKSDLIIEVKFPSGKTITLQVDDQGNGLKEYDNVLEYELMNGEMERIGIGTYVQVRNLVINSSSVSFNLIARSDKLVRWDRLTQGERAIRTPVIEAKSVEGGISSSPGADWMQLGKIDDVGNGFQIRIVRKKTK